MRTSEDDRYRDTTLTLANHLYRGRSVGSEMTCHTFPSLGICFDMGESSPSTTNIANVFLTHGHGDHAGGLAKHALRRDLVGLPPATYHVPDFYLDAVEDVFRASFELSRTRLQANVVPMGPETTIPLGSGFIVRGFQTTHCVPCLGYTVWSTRKRLRAEFRNLPGSELGRLRKEGADLDEHFEVPEITFCGDTSIDVLDQVPHVGRSRVLLLECTFLDDEVSPESARIRGGHVHIDHIVEAREHGRFQNKVVLLTHFSARYGVDEIREKVLRRLGDDSLFRLLLPEP